MKRRGRPAVRRDALDSINFRSVSQPGRKRGVVRWPEASARGCQAVGGDCADQPRVLHRGRRPATENQVDTSSQQRGAIGQVLELAAAQAGRRPRPHQPCVLPAPLAVKLHVRVGALFTTGSFGDEFMSPTTRVEAFRGRGVSCRVELRTEQLARLVTARPGEWSSGLDLEVGVDEQIFVSANVASTATNPRVNRRNGSQVAARPS